MAAARSGRVTRATASLAAVLALCSCSACSDAPTGPDNDNGKDNGNDNGNDNDNGHVDVDGDGDGDGDGDADGDGDGDGNGNGDGDGDGDGDGNGNGDGDGNGNGNGDGNGDGDGDGDGNGDADSDADGGPPPTTASPEPATPTPEETGDPPDCAASLEYEPVETRCDGLDNDCDGLVDFLLPVSANACDATDGACARGHAACSGSERICLARGPSPEAIDGEDNDCDGAIDDAAPSAVEPRVLLLRPAYLMEDSLGEIDNQTSFMEQWGIPYDVAEPLEDLDAQLAQLPGHALALFPGYLLPEVLNVPRLAALRQFVEAGGVLIVTKPVLPEAGPVGELLGIGRSERHSDLEELRFDGRAHAPATRLFDSPEERSVPLTAAPGEPAPDAYLLLEPAAGVVTVAHGVVGGQLAGAVVVRRSLGQGAIYTLGHNLHQFKHVRCYLNCFEPSGDLAGLFLREALREAARGHIVFIHPVPGAEDSVVLMTHDVDAWDAYYADPLWGDAGALQTADLERRHGARGSFMLATDYIDPYYAPELVGALCEREMCPVGVHSVTHGDIRSLPVGDCMETYADYPETRSLCGEVRVPLELVERDGAPRPVAWRSPYLYVPEPLYDVLESQGIGIDSSYAVGDLKFNLPISLARTGLNQHRFHRKNLYTVTITLEDGIGGLVDGVNMRMEMSQSNAARFESIWTYTALRNADNSAYTVALFHPSFGQNIAEDNLRYKLGVIDTFLAAAQTRGLRVDLTLADVLEFWRARESTHLAARYTAEGRYAGTLQVGSWPITDLTLEFGDSIGELQCASCGDVTLAGKRVVLRGTLAAGSSHAFEAIPAAP